MSSNFQFHSMSMVINFEEYRGMKEDFFFLYISYNPFHRDVNIIEVAKWGKKKKMCTTVNVTLRITVENRRFFLVRRKVNIDIPFNRKIFKIPSKWSTRSVFLQRIKMDNENPESLHFHGSKIARGYIFLPPWKRDDPMGSSRNSRNSSESSIPSACYVFMLDYAITIWASIQSSLTNVQRIYIYTRYSTVNDHGR